MIKIAEKYPVLTLLFLVLLMLLPNLNSLQVTIMEARNFITAREMTTNGHWLLTTMNGEPRYEKPPLPTWITAIFGLLFGIKNVFALRLPAVIMIFITGLFTYKVSYQLLQNKTHSFINGLIAITSFYVIGIIIEAPWDIYTHGFMLIAIFYMLKVYSKAQTKDLLVASFFIGCSFLSKGPVSVYALLLPFLIAYAIVFKINKKNVLKTLLMLVIGLLIGGWWYVYVRYADAEAFLAIATTETSRWADYNVRPFYYYWSFFTQSGLWTIPAFVGLLYPYLKNKVSHKKGYALSFYWVIITLILLSIIPEKKSRYLMPILIPLAINTGFYIDYLIRCFKSLKDKKETLPVYFNFTLLGSIGLAFPIVGYLLFKEELQTVLGSYMVASVVLFLIGGTLLFQLYKKQMKQVFYITVLLFAAIMLTVIPMSQAFVHQNEDYKSISSLKNDMSHQQLEVYVLDAMAPEMLWDYGNDIPMIPKNDQGYEFPEADMFVVLVTNEIVLNNEIIQKEYAIKKVATYDLNVADSQSKSYKIRLKSNCYLFKRK